MITLEFIYIACPIQGEDSQFVSCKWYQQHSCCTQTDAAVINDQAQNEYKQFSNVTVGCSDLIGLVACAPCPSSSMNCLIAVYSISHELLQGQIYRNYTMYGETVPVLAVCPDFCTHLFQQCENVIDATGRLLVSSFPAPDKFCQALLGSLVLDEGSGSCFNGAGMTSWSWLASGVVMLAVAWLW